MRSFGEFLFHLLWLAIAEGLTVEFLRSEIQIVRSQIDKHVKEDSDEPELSESPDSPETEKFPEYVKFHQLHGQQFNC